MKGGASTPTAELKATSAGTYLDDQMTQLRSIKDSNLHTDSPGVIGWVKDVAYKPGEIELNSCEDFRLVNLIDKTGKVRKPQNPGTRVYGQALTVRKFGNVWKVAKYETSKQLEDCQR